MYWISVKHQLPEINQYVLTYEAGYPLMRIKVNYLLDIPGNQIKFSYGKTDRITHWMPLPEPPIRNNCLNEKNK
jgi:hypothetical protein